MIWLIVLVVCAGERLGRGIVTDAITTPVVNTTAYHFKKTAELIDFKVIIRSLNIPLKEVLNYVEF